MNDAILYVMSILIGIIGIGIISILSNIDDNLKEIIKALNKDA